MSEIDELRRERTDNLRLAELRDKQAAVMHAELDQLAQLEKTVVESAKRWRATHGASEIRRLIATQALRNAIDALLRAEPCPECGGEGFVTQDGFDGRHYQRERPCPRCSRKG